MQCSHQPLCINWFVGQAYIMLVLVWFVFYFCFFEFVFLVFVFLCLCVVFFPLVVCRSLRASFLSFFHPSCPSIPFCFSAAMVALLRLWRHVCTGIHTFCSLCVRRVGVGVVTHSVLVGAAMGMLYLAVEYGRHTFCSLRERVCGGGHVSSTTPLGHLCWRGYRCAFLVFVA